jgi:hypothetical protein
MDERGLMGIYADTVFTYDARKRMLRSNEPCVQARRPAPLVYLGRTAAGDIVRFGAAVPDALAHQLEEIIDRLPPVSDLHPSPDALTAIREALEQYAVVTAEGGGPVYHFPDLITPQGEVIQLTDANIEMTRHTYPWLLEEFPDWAPCFAAVHDGQAVSVCFSSRVTAGADAAGVETLPAFRGRGYAASVTAAWGAAIREDGRIPLYSTSWENLASQGVARRVGLVRFGADISWE